MVIVARSRSINGPWENCPHNPVVHTASAAEPWWSRGHATAVQGPAGDWWLAYHGYENGYRTLGRQMLLEPFAWGDDGWPHALGAICRIRSRHRAGAGMKGRGWRCPDLSRLPCWAHG
jgi:beta-xylosidase